MARPIKRGLDYFPVDVNFFRDIKVQKLGRHREVNGQFIFIHILAAIYNEGYYLTYDNDTAFAIANMAGEREESVEVVIRYCLELGLLSREMFEKHGILTSVGIQRRFQMVSETTRRKTRVVEFSLLVSSEETPVSSEETRVNSEETPVSSEETRVNSEETPQRKEKKRKIKENIPPSVPPKSGEVEEVDDSFSSSTSAAAEVGILKPPYDGRKRNYDGLLEDLQALRMTNGQINALLRMSDFGRIGAPIFKVLYNCRDVLFNGTINMPYQFIVYKLNEYTSTDGGG